MSRAQHPDAPPADPDVVAVLEQSRPRWGPRLALAAAGLALLGAAAWAGMSGEQTRYQTATVERSELVRTVTAVGTLEAVGEVEVSSELSGRVASVAVDANTAVAAGDELARLDRRTFEHAVTKARAQLQSARAGLARARAAAAAATLDRQRAERLFARGAATEEALEDARASEDSAAADVRSAQAEVAMQSAALGEAEDDLERTVIVSPVDGVVLSREVEPGQTVVSTMSATALFTVASRLDRLEAAVAIDEADVGSVTASMPARFTVSAWPGRSFSAALERVDLAPNASDDVVTYDGLLAVDNPDLALRPGMTATAAIEVERLSDVLLVPSRALRWSPPRKGPGLPGQKPERQQSSPDDTVWVLESGTPQQQVVEVLGTDGQNTAVRGDGLEAGDAVVVGIDSSEEEE